MLMKKIAAFIFVIIISCSKDNPSTNPVENSGLAYSLSVSASEGGSVAYDNPNGGVFFEGEKINISATAEESHYFMAWSNGSRENPLQIYIESDTTLTAKFINKQNLITRFDEIVIGTGENGPQFTLRWDEMKIFLEGRATEEFNTELLNFIDELNYILNNDSSFSSTKVGVRSESNVHMFVTEADTYVEAYPRYENNQLENYLGYASWFSNNNGSIYSGNIFVNSPRMNKTDVIRWTIRHELGHVLGLKHTEDTSSIMHQNYIQGSNIVFSDLDHETLRFLHDDRMPVFADSDQSRAILEEILGINNNKIAANKNKPNTSLKRDIIASEVIFVCSKK